MAKIDKIKELIGYLKVLFGILVAIDISIIGWLFKNQSYLSQFKILLSVSAIIITTIGIIIINKKILQKIDELEDIQMDTLVILSAIFAIMGIAYAIYETLTHDSKIKHS